MIRIPEYDDQVKLRDAPDVQQSFRTDPSMFGGNRAKDLDAWGEALGDAGDAFGTAAENEKKKQEKQAAESASLLTGGNGNSTLEGGGGNDGLSRSEDTAQPGTGAPRQGPRPDGDAEPASPALPAHRDTASIGSTFNRPDLPVRDLTELREAQTDLAGKFGQWLKDVFGGSLTPDEARANLRDEVKSHTIGMKSSQAIEALRAWENRQHRHLDAAGQGGGTDQEKLFAARTKRTEQRHRNVAESGGDMAVLAPQATRLVRDIWQDGRALGLSGEEIDAKVRGELARLSATAVLAMATSDPAQALRNLEALKAKNFIDAETAKSLGLGGEPSSDAPSAVAATAADATPAIPDPETAPSAIRKQEHSKGEFRGPSSPQPDSSDSDGGGHPADEALDSEKDASPLDGDEDDGLDAAELGASRQMAGRRSGGPPAGLQQRHGTFIRRG